VDITSDRRENQRFKYEAIIWHNSILPGIFYKARLCNISKTGVYFETDQSLYPGEKIYIAKKSDSSISNRKDINRVEIKWRKDSTKGFDHIEIKWRKELKNSSSQYGYGAVFIGSNPNLEKLLEMVDVNKNKNGNDNLKAKKDPRELTRENYRKEITFSAKDQSYKGFISNISRVGAFIETKTKFSLGQMIRLEIPGDSLFKDLKLNGWVVRLEPEGVGIKFERRSGRERRKDLDRRRGPDRRTQRKPKGAGKKEK
jgi:Tfp pilus assembly protein PilZ